MADNQTPNPLPTSQAPDQKKPDKSSLKIKWKELNQNKTFLLIKKIII